MDEEILKHLATKQDIEELREELKKEFKQSQSEVFSRMDEMLVILRRVDQERVFTFEYVKRLETEVEKNRKDIDHIKDILKIS